MWNNFCIGNKSEDERNIIEMYKYDAVERDQLCNLLLVQVLEATCETTGNEMKIDGGN